MAFTRLGLGGYPIAATSRVRTIATAVTVMQAQSIGLAKAVSKAFLMSQTQAVIASAGKGALKTLAIFQTQLMGLIKSPSKVIAISQIQLLTLAKAFEKTIAISQVQTLSLGKSLGKIVQVTQANILALFRSIGHGFSLQQAQMVHAGIAFNSLIAFTQSQISAMVRLVTHGITPAIQQGQNLIYAVQKAVVIPLFQSQAIALFKQTLKTIVFVSIQNIIFSVFRTPTPGDAVAVIDASTYNAVIPEPESDC